MAQICNQMLVPCNKLVRLVMAEEDYNNFEASTLGTVSSK
jgi:hypothetical protein